MAGNPKEKRSPPTARGAATKMRIVEAAAMLIYQSGAERVSLDHVMEASGASKSQLYHYFADKNDLLREVVGLQASRIVGANSTYLDGLRSLKDLAEWRNMMLAAHRAAGMVGGCPLGSLANELAGQSEETRILLDRSFGAWSAVIESSLSRLKAIGEIVPSADTKTLSVAVLAAIQGGILLSKSSRNSAPLEAALDMAFDHIKRYAA